MHNFAQTIAYAATIPIIIFLIFLLFPLYKLAGDRTAIYIMFSKTCFNILEMSLVSAYSLVDYLIWPSELPEYIHQPYVYSIQSALFATFVHFLAMAINRFHAVFMPFSYLSVWNKRNTHLYIIFVSLFGISLGSAYISLIPLIGSSWILHSVQYSVLGISGAIYLAMIVKFAIEFYELKNSQNAPTDANLEKDRILLSAIALISVFPLLFSVLISNQQKIYDIDSTLGIVLNSLRIANYALMQCVEEFCLIIFCRDFRTIIRRQYVFILCGKNSTNEVTTMVSRVANGGKVMAPCANLKQTNQNQPQIGTLSTRSAWKNN